jgi:hypothetical protein
MASSTASDWCTTSTGPSAIRFRSLSVTTMATSRIRSRSGSSPDISISTQTRWLSFSTYAFLGGCCDTAQSRASPLVQKADCGIIAAAASSRPPAPVRAAIDSGEPLDYATPPNLFRSIAYPTPMASFSTLFMAAFILTFGLKIWLALPDASCLDLHRDTPPDAFAGRSFQSKSTARPPSYTLAKARLGLMHLADRSRTAAGSSPSAAACNWLQDTLSSALTDSPIAGRCTALLLGLLPDQRHGRDCRWALYRPVPASRPGSASTGRQPAGFVADLGQERPCWAW